MHILILHIPLFHNRRPVSFNGNQMQRDAGGDDDQRNLEPEGGNDETDCIGDGQPQQQQRQYLLSERHAQAFMVIADVFAEPAVGHQPVVKALGTAGVTPCGEQQERRSRQHRQQHAEDGQNDEQGSGGDEKGFT